MALFDTTFSPYYPFGSRTLTPGVSGTDVAVVQAVYDLMLGTMNPPQGPMGASIPITGLYDTATVSAVTNIQSYFGLTVDGVVGPQTFFVFGQGVGPYTTYGGPVYGSRQLSLGQSGGDVLVLQNRLNCFRYAALLNEPATGRFDAATAKVVAAFKADAERNGDTGFPDNAIAGFGYYDASWLYTLAGGRAIESGRNGFDVVFIQVLLNKLGYYVGNITGYYDAATRTAVLNFQAQNDIAADGVVGPQTFYHMGLVNPAAAPDPLGVAWPPAPAPNVTLCQTALLTQTPSLTPYGVATIAINQDEGFESLDVVGNLLPPPSSFGAFNAYAFLLIDPSSGQTLAMEAMTLVSMDDNPGDWAGAYSPGVSSILPGRVSVYAYHTSTALYGSLVLQGTFSGCPDTAAP